MIGKTWIENHNLSYKENYKVIGETNINNKSYYVINCSSVDCNGIVSNFEDFWSFRQDGDKIFKYDEINNNEILFFDFGLSVGDVFHSTTGGQFAIETDIEVIDVYYEIFNGYERKCLAVGDVGDNIVRDVWIEGVGAKEGGISYNYMSHIMGKKRQLESCFVEGEYIYGSAVPWTYIYKYTPLLQEYLVWNYGNESIWLSGEKEIGGKTYKICYCDTNIRKSTEDLKPYAYLREEDGCVYAIVDEDCDTQNMFVNYESVGEEQLIYDFNLNVGDESVMGEISAIEFVVIDVELRKKYIIENAHKEYIEGIGTVGEYSLCFCCPDCPLPTSGYKAPSLNYVSNFDGRLIYAEDDDWNGDPCKEGGNAIESIVDDVASILIEQRSNSICVKINGDGKIALSVYDLVGVKVAEASGDGEVSLSTDTLPIGIYIVKAISDNGIETAEKKIVIK